VLARPAGTRPPVLLAGHLDTVPAQGNRPGRFDGERVHGLGASDMKGALAVMIELGLAGVPYGLLFFGREELPADESALRPLLGRARDALAAELVLMMEPTDNAIHAGCLGNINAAWRFQGRSGHSARPWEAENAIHLAATAIAELARREPEPHEFDGLVFREVASVTKIAGGIASNVIPGEAEALVNFRYAPGRSPEEAETRLAELCRGGTLEILSNSPSGPVATANPHARRLAALGNLEVAPKQAWTPVAEFGLFGLEAINFGPGAPAQAHQAGEFVEASALVRSFELLESFA
jgi:succinyl-diaminopimelate desuccinylase